MKTTKHPLLLIQAFLSISTPSFLLAGDTVKVFLLAGQSNMVGYGRIETGVGDVVGAIGSLRYEVDQDPDNYGHLVDESGGWKVRNDVWVWARQSEYIYQPPGNRDRFSTGNLTAGFGHDSHAARTALGPELGFGTIIGDFHEEQVVLVKAAWGGATLAFNFRPPTAAADRGGAVGAYYNLMLDAFEEALVDIAAHFPGQEIEIAGFGWHQGWSDRINQSYNNEYEENLADFIVDVRTALGAPSLPFVIAETGHGGLGETDPLALSLMTAQASIVDAEKYPEFDGNVGFTDTQEFWRDVNVSPRNVNFHWNENGETYYLIGKAMGEAMTSLLQATPAPPLPGIRSIKLISDRVWELTVEGPANTGYEFHSSLNLDFEASALITGLFQGSPENDPGTVNSPSLLTTDENGKGTLRLTLDDHPAAFIRAQIP